MFCLQQEKKKIAVMNEPLIVWSNFTFILESIRTTQYELGLFNFVYCCHGKQLKLVPLRF
jgi:hypothetical protein